MKARRSLAWRSGVLDSFKAGEGSFCAALALVWAEETPLDTEPAGRCVMGLVLPFDQALGTDGFLLKLMLDKLVQMMCRPGQMKWGKSS